MATDATNPSESTGLPAEIADLQVKISNFKDEVRDITNLCHGFSIYEDLFAPTSSIELMIVDAEGLLEQTPIIGDEHITITYRTRGVKKVTGSGNESLEMAALDVETGETGELYEVRVRSYQIYKLAKKQEVEERQHAYILFGVDDHQVMNEMIDLNQSYVGQNCIKAIDNIFKSSFIKNVDDTFRPFNIQPKLNGIGTNDPIESTNSSFYISPGVTPFEAITHLREEAEHKETSLKNNSDYVFYQDYEGFHITTLSELKSAPAKYDYTVKDMGANNDKKTDGTSKSGNDSGDEYSTVIEFQINKNFDTIQHLSLGTYGNRVAAIDLLTKRFDERSFSYGAAHESLNPMGLGKLHSNDSLYRFSGSTHTRFIPTELLSSSIPTGEPTGFTNELSSYSQHPYFYPVGGSGKEEGTLANDAAAEKRDSIVKNDPKIANPRRKQYLLNKRIAGKGILDTMMLDLKIPGNSDLKVGDTINFFVPQTSRESFAYNDLFGAGKGSNVSPKFLVVKLNQKYINEVSSYHTFLTIVKDGYAISPEAALEKVKEDRGDSD